MRLARLALGCLWAGLLLAPFGAQAQAKKWVEPDGRVIYSDTQPSATAKEASAVAGTGAASATPATGGGRNEAGKIELVEGTVTVVGADRARRAPKVGETLYEGDAILTDKDGELQAEMTDSGVIAVRPNTSMRINKYQANGDASDTSIFGLLKGSFRSITGWIGKTNPSNYQIHTPTATMGVRGTDHEPLVIPPGSTEGEPGTYDKVLAGGTFIQGKNGSVDVTPGKAGFYPHSGSAKPRVLDQVPGFFRPTRNEGRLEGRNEKISQAFEQRRAERQKVIQERRAQQPQGRRAQAGQARAQAAQARGQAAQARGQAARERAQARGENAKAGAARRRTPEEEEAERRGRAK
jgi:hypothetical protein